MKSLKEDWKITLKRHNILRTIEAESQEAKEELKKEKK
jgi:hypothetical protein